MRFGHFLILCVLVVGIYVFPTVIATFAGSHTLERNESGGAASLQCTTCHEYILEELSTTAASSGILQKHRNAAGNSSYTEGWLNLTIDNTTEYGVCQLCHLGQTLVVGRHTQTVVRVCTDPDCHGNNATTNNTAYYAAGIVGSHLGNVTNVHGNWFKAMGALSSNYTNETGTNYTLDYWACLACHTSVEIDKEITEGSFAHDDPNAGRDRYL